MLSEYESRALAQIHAWKNPGQTWFDSAMTYVNRPLELLGQAVEKVPGFNEACSRAAKGIFGLINDFSQWSVNSSSIFKDLSLHSSQEITKFDQVRLLDLSVVDRAIGWLDTKYEGIALVEGAAVGGVSTFNPALALAAIPMDLVALLTLNLRAIGEYGAYCGFDMTSQEERLFSLNVLALASSSTDAGKQAALAHLVKIAKDTARKKSWEHLEKSAFVKIVQSISEALGVRLTKEKLASVIPYAGVAVNGGFNAYYTDKVCKSAFYLYRERFLAEKSGSDSIEETVAPAKTDAWIPPEAEA